MIRRYYLNKTYVKVVTKFEEEKIKEELQQMNQKYSQYDYLFDGNLSPEQKLVQYINQSEGSDYWTVDKFVDFMNYIEKL